jgi:hypothetical protein
LETVGFDESTLEMSCEEKEDSSDDDDGCSDAGEVEDDTTPATDNLAVRSAVHADFLHARLVQFSGECLQTLLGEAAKSLANITASVRQVPLITRMSSSAAKHTANEQRQLYLTEAIMQLTEVTAEVVALQSRLLLAGSLKDQQLDPRCNAFRFRDRHFRVDYPVYEPTTSESQCESPRQPGWFSSSSASNDNYGGFTGVRIVS